MKLTPGVALLWHRERWATRGKWVDAVTDELAVETASFLGWIDARAKVSAEPRTHAEGGPRIYAFKKPMRSRMAVFVDANGRRWAQKDETRQGVNMIVKVTVTDAGVEVRNKDGSLKYLAPLSSPMLARLRGANVAFFNAVVEKDVIEIDERITDERKMW